jgi:glycosyltransferase involved in cell wall biosynthesis
MTTYEKFDANILIASNTIGVPTGYGQQGLQIAERFLRHGFTVGNASNYGLEGRTDTLKLKHGSVKHYPRGMRAYSDDVLPVWFEQLKDDNPGKPSAVLTLYDAWVYLDALKQGHFKDMPIMAWAPIDHVTIPPKVLEFLKHEQVTPLAMSPHGQRSLEEQGVISHYIPHAIDTKVFKPTHTVNGMPTREFLGVPDDAFLVSMVGANKANGQVHRKGYAEALLAFAIFQRANPDAYLYLHTDIRPAMGGFDIGRLLQAVGLSKDRVIIADPQALHLGYPQEALAAFYTASDVLLATNYGGGFEIPVIEAQACGTRVITSGWTATQDLASEDSWLVDGQPFWNETQAAFWQIPLVPSIVQALQLAHDAERGESKTAIEFASKFDTERVWSWYWLPFLRGYFK